MDIINMVLTVKKMYMYTFTYLLEITRSKSGSERKPKRLPSARLTVPMWLVYNIRTGHVCAVSLPARTFPTHTLRHSDPSCRSRTYRFVRDNSNYLYQDVQSVSHLYTLTLYNITELYEENSVVYITLVETPRGASRRFPRSGFNSA